MPINPTQPTSHCRDPEEGGLCPDTQCADSSVLFPPLAWFPVGSAQSWHRGCQQLSLHVMGCEAMHRVAILPAHRNEPLLPCHTRKVGLSSPATNTGLPLSGITAAVAHHGRQVGGMATHPILCRPGYWWLWCEVCSTNRKPGRVGNGWGVGVRRLCVLHNLAWSQLQQNRVAQGTAFPPQAPGSSW